MACNSGAFLLLYLTIVVSVHSTQYCSSVTLGRVTSISCSDHYHCCEGSTRCCLDSGYLTNSGIVGIAVGGAVLIVLIVCLTICYVRSKNKQSAPTQTAETEIGDEDSNPEHAGYNQSVAKEGCSYQPPPYTTSSENPPDYMK